MVMAAHCECTSGNSFWHSLYFKCSIKQNLHLFLYFHIINSLHQMIILPRSIYNWKPSIIIIKMLFLSYPMDRVLGQVPWKTDEADLHARSLLGSALKNICKGEREAELDREAEPQ